ncbi:MAG: restriction endonuclease subunit S, partial [Candidatus Bipolaricaulota bacterium]|nr:restriction endonuclease subunit S [Candidatus Bipolaricaulota bacterium]
APPPDGTADQRVVRGAVMITNLKPYPKMKDSGVEWLGEVPEHWEVRRLQTISDMRVSNVDKHTKEDETPVRLCNYVDVYNNDRISEQMDFMRATATSEEIELFRLAANDVLITKDSESWDDIGVPALVTKSANDFISGYHLALLRAFTSLLSGDYLFRALQSKTVAYQFHVGAKGVTRYGLSHAGIKSVWLPLPPLPEQAAIVRYLDYVDRRIRRYIREKRKLIKLLTEQKQAIIHRAVTRGLPAAAAAQAGLDPNVPFKPSGVEWLGQVPEHWEVRKLRFDFRYAKGSRAAELTNEYIGANPGPFPVFSGQTENNGLMGSISWHEFDFENDVILVTTVGARAMSTRLISGAFSLSQNCAIIVPRDNRTSTSYYEMVMHRLFAYEKASISLIMQPSLRFSDLNRFYIPAPPFSEQAAIVEHLNEPTADIDTAIARAKREIELLGEYRTRLIADVVTGKLDVRGYNVVEESDDTAPEGG